VRLEELNTLGAASESREIFPCAFFIRVLLIITLRQPFGFIQYQTMNIDYERVAENDSDSHDYSNKFEENEGHTPFVGNPRSGKWGLLLTLLNIVLFTISATVWGIAFADHLPTTSQALQKVLYYCSCRDLTAVIRMQLLTRTSPAPLLDKIEFQFENRKVEGTLFDEETLSKDELLLRSHSNDASDAAWAALSVIERIPMTAEEVRRLGKDPDTVVKIPPSYGSSDLRFLGKVIAEKYPIHRFW
jgi:hypothetical protein